ALRGTRLYVDRDALPEVDDGQYYHADLVGLTAMDSAGKPYGRVMAVHDYGAGVFLEIGTNKKDSFMLPFKDAQVPEVDLAAGRVVIAVPDGWLDKRQPEGTENEADNEAAEG
ncbi:MAG: 16S rRNA processing protein RimM, partial [Alphaproteobacteria bacterium]|nr:16S rRNA processing protein RimM [Alphaproteobacteria bacterium]